jgi:hypothetical protein
VLEQVLTNLSLEDLRTCSLVSKRFLDASNALRKSVTFDKWAGKERLARLAARFSNATAAAFAGNRGCSQLEGIEGILSSMTHLQRLDLSELQLEISVRSATLASILRSVRSLRILTLQEPLLCTRVDSTAYPVFANPVVPGVSTKYLLLNRVVPDLATTPRTLEQVLLSIGEECPELEALHIMPTSSYDWKPFQLRLGDYAAACTQLISKCPRLGVLDPLIVDQRNLEAPYSLNVSTCIGTNLSSVTLSYSSKDALADMLLRSCLLSSLRELKVVPFQKKLGGSGNPALQAALQEFALSSPSELSALDLVQTPVEKGAAHMILAHCTELRKLYLDYVKFDGEWEGDLHIGHEIGLPETGSKSIRVLSWKQELVGDRKKANQVDLEMFSQNFPSLEELALEACFNDPLETVQVKYGAGVIAPLLTSLSFQNCSLGNPENLSRFCPNLATLKLSDACFSQGKLKRVSDLFPQLRKITLDTQLSIRQPLRLLPPALGPVPSVSHLELITDHTDNLEGLTSLRVRFPGLSVLRVTFSGSLLTGITATALMRICARCERLRYLYVTLRGSEFNYNSWCEKMECLCPAHITLVFKQLE